MENSLLLKEYYARYLTEVRNVSASTVRHYYDALKHISRRLKEKGLVVNDIYEIDNLDQLMYAREVLYADEEFVAMDQKGHHMYSVGLNHYCKFASGEQFFELKEKINLLDVPIKVEAQIKTTQTSWKRSGIIRTQAIEYAGYECELGTEHKTFIAESTGKPYMEGHHAIPMSLQEHFDNSLDIYANIICLCPLCHRKIHHGLKHDKAEMLDQIYVMRSDRLANSGIKLSKDEFKQLIVCSK